MPLKNAEGLALSSSRWCVIMFPKAEDQNITDSQMTGIYGRSMDNLLTFCF
jgi:hypothetical protein